MIRLPRLNPAPTSMPWWTRGDLNAFFGLGFNILVNVLTLTGLDDRRRRGPCGRRARHGTARSRRRADTRQPLLHVPRAPTGSAREPRRRHRAAVRPECAAHVHRRLRGDAAGLSEHQRPAAGLASRAGVGLHDRCDRDDRRVCRSLHSQAHAPRRDARHPRGHFDHVHLDAARGADVGGRVDRPSGDGHHPDRVLHQCETPVRHPGWARRAARRHGHRLDRRLHVRAGRRTGGVRHRDRDTRPSDRHAVLGSVAPGAAAGHRNSVGRLQLHRGDEQRRERRCGR